MNFHLNDPLAPDVLCRALTDTASFLQQLDPSSPLGLYDDWLQHDGLVFERLRRSDFRRLLDIVATPKSLHAHMTGDHEVRLGVAPATTKLHPTPPWYLRFILCLDADDRDLEGDFDLTLPPDHAPAYRRLAAERFPFPVAEEDATSYYHRIDAS